MKKLISGSKINHFLFTAFPKTIFLGLIVILILFVLYFLNSNFGSFGIFLISNFKTIIKLLIFLLLFFLWHLILPVEIEKMYEIGFNQFIINRYEFTLNDIEYIHVVKTKIVKIIYLINSKMKFYHIGIKVKSKDKYGPEYISYHFFLFEKKKLIDLLKLNIFLSSKKNYMIDYLIKKGFDKNRIKYEEEIENTEIV